MEEPILQFPVISDIHISNEITKSRLKVALDDYRLIAPNYQAIAIVGDMTNYGAESEYEDFNKILETYSISKAEKIITIGNHEYMEGESSPNGLDEKLYQTRFLTKTKMPGIDSSVYYDKWIEGYHFIAMGSEGYLSNGNEFDNDYAKISDQQYRWLENKLAEKAEPTKPIFVFLHQGIDHTVYGTDYWGAGFTDTRLYDLLNQYPQVILFSGHSHYILNHPRTIYQAGFTMVNAGAVAYGFTDLGSTQTSQGLLVNVYENRVEIKAREFTNHTWVQEFTVRTPYVKTYGEVQKPVFKPGATFQVEENKSGVQVKLSWDAAWDDMFVEKYIIKQNNQIIQTVYTRYWDESQGDKIYANLGNLSPNTDYNLDITAVDAWNNESNNTLSIKLKTSELNGWLRENGNWRFYENGKYIVGWKFISSRWYFFSKDGSMHTGWYSDGTHYYYLNSEGHMEIGWKKIDGKEYYFGSNGVMRTGWILVSDKWYFLNSDGSAKYGWVYTGGKWYFVESTGMLTGWKRFGNNDWYLFNNSGAMQTGWVITGGKWYYMNPSGLMVTGWLKYKNSYYYLESSGSMKTGWLLENGTWYYLKNDGIMVTGWMNINQTWYYFSNSGALR